MALYWGKYTALAAAAKNYVFVSPIGNDSDVAIPFTASVSASTTVTFVPATAGDAIANHLQPYDFIRIGTVAAQVVSITNATQIVVGKAITATTNQAYFVSGSSRSPKRTISSANTLLTTSVADTAVTPYHCIVSDGTYEENFSSGLGVNFRVMALNRWKVILKTTVAQTSILYFQIYGCKLDGTNSFAVGYSSTTSAVIKYIDCYITAPLAPYTVYSNNGGYFSAYFLNTIVNFASRGNISLSNTQSGVLTSDYSSITIKNANVFIFKNTIEYYNIAFENCNVYIGGTTIVANSIFKNCYFALWTGVAITLANFLTTTNYSTLKLYDGVTVNITLADLWTAYADAACKITSKDALFATTFGTCALIPTTGDLFLNTALENFILKTTSAANTMSAAVNLAAYNSVYKTLGTKSAGKFVGVFGKGREVKVVATNTVGLNEFQKTSKVNFDDPINDSITITDVNTLATIETNIIQLANVPVNNIVPLAILSEFGNIPFYNLLTAISNYGNEVVAGATALTVNNFYLADDDIAVRGNIFGNETNPISFLITTRQYVCDGAGVTVDSVLRADGYVFTYTVSVTTVTMDAYSFVREYLTYSYPTIFRALGQHLTALVSGNVHEVLNNNIFSLEAKWHNTDSTLAVASYKKVLHNQAISLDNVLVANGETAFNWASYTAVYAKYIQFKLSVNKDIQNG